LILVSLIVIYQGRLLYKLLGEKFNKNCDITLEFSLKIKARSEFTIYPVRRDSVGRMTSGSRWGSPRRTCEHSATFSGFGSSRNRSCTV